MAQVKTAATRSPARSSFSQVREAGESILFALILAFVFRGFVGQAFVIPTGSMAPTLLGSHMDHVCSSCGYGYAVSLDRCRPGEMPGRVKCPNCDWEDTPHGTPQAASAGDGIFTLSWPFALGSKRLDPQRWDVIVFKAPFNMQTNSKGLPVEREGQTNYIKRLVGLPGDVLAILDGDVYTAQAAALPEPIRQGLLNNSLTGEQKEQLNEFLRIERKTTKAQSALWQVVFDADYPPSRREAPGWKPLQPDSHWKLNKTEKRIFRFVGKGAPAEFMQLEGKDFLDHCRYNFDRSDDRGYAGTGRFVVSDLLLRCTATWQDCDGALLLRLSKRDKLYTVELSPGEGTGRVLQSALDGSQEVVLGSLEFHPWKRNWPVAVAFANVDRRLQVWMSDALVWQSPAEVFTASQARREPAETHVPLVQIGAADLQVELRHVAVMRDIYYRDDVPVQVFRSPSHIEQAAPSRYAESQANKAGWGTRDNPMLLLDGEYFMLGDNSPASYDSRAWGQAGAHLTGRELTYRQYRFGTVPADQLVGKAFFVYWPSWYRLFGLRVIPNVGQMRWIQ